MNNCAFLLRLEVNGEIEIRCNNWDCLYRHFCSHDIPQGANGAPLCKFLNRNEECPCYIPQRDQ